jgi:hypothetical protein
MKKDRPLQLMPRFVFVRELGKFLQKRLISHLKTLFLISTSLPLQLVCQSTITMPLISSKHVKF